MILLHTLHIFDYQWDYIIIQITHQTSISFINIKVFYNSNFHFLPLPWIISVHGLFHKLIQLEQHIICFENIYFLIIYFFTFLLTICIRVRFYESDGINNIFILTYICNICLSKAFWLYFSFSYSDTCLSKALPWFLSYRIFIWPYMKRITLQIFHIPLDCGLISELCCKLVTQTGTCYLVPGTWYLGGPSVKMVPGIWYLVPGRSCSLNWYWYLFWIILVYSNW